MTSISKPLLTIDAAVIYSEMLCNPWALLEHLSDARKKTDAYDNFRCFSAHNEKVTTANIEVDFNTFYHYNVLDIKTPEDIAYNMRDLDRLVFADCYVLVHDWTSSNSIDIVIQCIKRCKELFVEDTPMIIVGINRNKKTEILASKFNESPLKEMQIAQFDFGSNISLTDSLLPFLISQVFFKTEDMRGFGELKLPYKALVPRSSDSKLEPIFLPINETLQLGRKEMIKKGSPEKRIGKIHLMIHHSDLGKVAIKALGTNELMIDNPSAEYLHQAHSMDDLVELEDVAEVCLLVNGSSDDKDILTYIIRSGDEAITAVSNVKYQSGYSLLKELTSKAIELGSLLPTIRKSLTESKRVKMELKLIKYQLKESIESDVDLGRLQWDYVDGESSSSDEDDFNGPTQRVTDGLNDLSF
jgi:hypothetical protein